LSDGDFIAKTAVRLKRGRLPIVLIFFLLALWPFSAAAQGPSLPVRSIDIRGNRRVEEPTIRFYISTRVGEPFSVPRLRRDIKKIYDLGFFRDVKVDVAPFEGGLRVIFIVEEKPSIASVRFVGNKNVETEDIQEKVTVTVQSILNQGTVRETVEAIRSLYQENGYYFARIDSIVEEAGANQVNVEFRITEGEKVSITEISFEGNKAFTAKQLRKVMQTEERWILTWFTGNDVYKEDQIRTDLVRIQIWYQNNGYIRAEVKEPRIVENREENSLTIVIPVVEGKQYLVGKLEVDGDDVFSGDETRKKIELKKGDVYNRSKLNSYIVKVTEDYAQKGYAFADIIPQTSINDEELLVDIRIIPQKGRRAYIGTVLIKGNDFTRDKVIRREVALLEGSLYDGEKLKLTRRRLRRLGFFDNVKIETKRGKSPDLLDVEIEVSERPTGVISGGAGFSSRAGILLFGEIRENNLFGRGQTVSLQIRRSDLDTTGTLSFVEPHFLDTNFSLSSSLFERNRVGGNLGFGHPLTEHTFARLTYQLEENEIFNVDVNANQFIKDQQGKITVGSLIPALVRDTRDDRIRPTSGGFSLVSTRVASPYLAGDNNFYSALAEHRQYVPLFKKRVIIMGRSRITWADGFAGGKLPAFERSFLGGSRSVRGFEFREIGPKDANGNPIGGNASILFNVELQFPFIAGLRAVIFYDSGQVYQESGVYDLTELRHSAGAGLRILSPLGPISLDWGVKLDRKEGESLTEFHFGIGRTF
jgi:outer membrane protein insertion porin family